MKGIYFQISVTMTLPGPVDELEEEEISGKRRILWKSLWLNLPNTFFPNRIIGSSCEIASNVQKYSQKIKRCGGKK